MNKNELIEAVAAKIDGTKADAARAIDATFETISSELAGGGEVRLVNFGTFLVANRKATTGRNPRTGEPIKIAASKNPKFRPGKILKQAVNN